MKNQAKTSRNFHFVLLMKFFDEIGKNLQFFDIYIVGIVSSVLARKLKCPSLAWLGLAQLVTFFTSAQNRKSAENELKFDSQLKNYF